MTSTLRLGGDAKYIKYNRRSIAEMKPNEIKYVKI
jgi:hypothetical protein